MSSAHCQGTRRPTRVTHAFICTQAHHWCCSGEAPADPAWCGTPALPLQPVQGSGWDRAFGIAVLVAAAPAAGGTAFGGAHRCVSANTYAAQLQSGASTTAAIYYHALQHWVFGRASCGRSYAHLTRRLQTPFDSCVARVSCVQARLATHKLRCAVSHRINSMRPSTIPCGPGDGWLRQR